MWKGVRIRGYFSKPKGAREQKSLEKPDLDIFFGPINSTSRWKPQIYPKCRLNIADAFMVSSHFFRCVALMFSA